MSADRFTRCPHCKATFKVSEDQLGVANGRVRCGACMNIFDAIAYTVSAPGATKAEPSKPFEPISDPIELDESIAEPTSNSDGESHHPETDTSQDASQEDWLIQDNPDEDKEEESYSGTRLSDELSSSFMELEREGGGKPYDPYGSETVDEDSDQGEDSDESWAQEILDDIDSPNKEDPIIPERPEEDLDEPENIPDFSTETPPAPNPEPLHFYDDQYAGTGKRSWVKTTVVSLLSLALLIVLLAQASWFHYEKLAKYPQIASLYEQACETLKCELPELIDITKIRSHNLVVRSHPTAKNALIIDAVIVNDADFIQPFPNLALYFSDINNNTVAQRLIKPSEYLPADFYAPDQMPSGQPIHISLEIRDPGKEAVNYKLKMFPAE